MVNERKTMPNLQCETILILVVFEAHIGIMIVVYLQLI